MLIGYARVSKADGSQSLDLQHDALRAAGVERDNIYDDLASGGRDDRPGLTACLKSLRDGDVLVVCSRNQDATTNAQIGLAQKYNRIVTTLDGLKKAVAEGDDLVS